MSERYCEEIALGCGWKGRHAEEAMGRYRSLIIMRIAAHEMPCAKHQTSIGLQRL